MNSLSDRSTAARILHRPVNTGADAQTALGTSWPAIPQPGYPHPLTLQAEEPCELLGAAGSITRVHLVSFDLEGRTIQVNPLRGRKAVQMRFDQFQRLDLLLPVHPLPAPPRGTPRLRPGLYCLTFKSGQRQFGLTLGVESQEAGLFLFEPADEQASVRRVFIPRSAIAALEFGEQAQARMSEPQEEITIALEPLDFTEVDVPVQAQPGGAGIEDGAATRAADPLGDASAAQAHDRAPGLSTPVVELLREQPATTPQDLEEGIARQARTPIIPLGEALIALGQIDAGQLQVAIKKQQANRGVPLGQLLVREGWVSREGLQMALVRKMGYPVVDLARFPVDPEALFKVSKPLALRLKALPLVIRQERLVVALDDPSRTKALDELEFAAGCKVTPVLALAGTMSAALKRNYEGMAHEARGGLEPVGGTLGQAESQGSGELLATLELESVEDTGDDQEAIEQSDNALVRLFNTMILEAQARGASDIHIESQPGNQKVNIRFRRDGVLAPYLQLPHTYRAALLARLKIMSALDISERRRPQDGKITMGKFVQGSRLELRVVTIPTFGGLEDAVLRLLSSARLIALDDLGLSPYNLAELKQLMRKPYGMFLCAGPTGSGKTTTLHSALATINGPERKIWTAEDPIEITQEGLRQVQVNPKIGWTFDKALRSLLRADPDIIMVGEIRDKETAQVAIESSLTGHLVLSTLHTNSAPETVTRLLDMGMDPFNFGDSLLGVLSQRLVRKLCPHCRTARPATQLEIEALAADYLQSFGEARNRPTTAALVGQWTQRFGRSRQDLSVHDPSGQGLLVHHESPGCDMCAGTGYQGRAGIHELLLATRELRHMIQTGARTDDIQKAAIESGMRTLRQDGIEKVLSGVTSILEVRATTGS